MSGLETGSGQGHLTSLTELSELQIAQANLLGANETAIILQEMIRDGKTSSNGNRIVQLETGELVRVPIFIEIGREQKEK